MSWHLASILYSSGGGYSEEIQENGDMKPPAKFFLSLGGFSIVAACTALNRLYKPRVLTVGVICF